jgi:transcriptional regulator with XRE-family HTH domain
MAKKVSTSRSKKSLSPMLKRWGGAIRRRRVGAGISQTQLAETVHCTVKLLDGFEKGLRDPYLHVVLDIAKALNYGTDDLFSDARI